jgi:tRNA-splicing ligase RtcB
MKNQIEIKKVSENIYQIPKSANMNVPAIVFASEKLLEDIKRDKTLEQIKNVATLPGIVRASIAMPDAHQGYGFSIGGVAAFDLDKGIISPGGVGYDINCLTGDSRIVTEFGSNIKIEEFEKYYPEIELDQANLKIKTGSFNLNLNTLNMQNKEIENKKIVLFMHKNNEQIYEIKLNSGLSIKSTLDHPFLTKSGMKPFSSLSNNELLAINLFEGVSCSEFIDEKLAISTKILGYLFGDGCLYFSKRKYYCVAYGPKLDLENMQKDLIRLNVNSSIYSRTRNHEIQTKYKLNKFTTTNYELHIHSQDFCKFLVKLGMPLGNKTRQEVIFPEWIKKSNQLMKRLFLAGFFGAEMSSPKTSSKTCFNCPTLNQNKIESLSQNMRNFLIQISLMLEEFGVKTAKISEMDDFHNKFGEKTKRFRLILSSDNENLIKLYRNIGFEYNLKRKNLANIACLYILLKEKENIKRTEISSKIKEYKKKGFKLKEVQNIFEGVINNRFISRHYYENAGQRINLDFISFEDFCKLKLKEIEDFGAIFDNINETKKIEGTHKVYDFNIEDNHNFIANGFIVSNCGIRLLSTNIKIEDFMKKRKEILHSIFRSVPSGVGVGGKRYSREELLEVLEKGALFAVERKMGTIADLEHTEENGKMSPANPKDVSQRAIARGLPQLGTLGAGNHFLEIQKVDKIFDEKIAKEFGLDKDNIVLMIHCGSRGLGHQVASDYIKLMEDKYGFDKLVDRELINAPIKSELGQKYLSAMNCAVNFAFCNRQMIMHQVREQFKYYFPKSQIKLVYDVCHNIAKIEEHVVDGKKVKLCVHRKGATRSFGPGRKEIPEAYRKIGQPVIIPGSMGTASYVLVGTKKAEEISFGSTAHGAGRLESRTQARREMSSYQVRKQLEAKDILVEAGSYKGLVEESPESYKDVDEVVRVSDELGIGKLVARFVPLAVMKG